MTEEDADRLAVEVGARIRALREARGLSLQDIVARGGVGSKARMSLIERGMTQPTLASLARIASSLEIGVEELLPARAPDRDDIVARVRTLDDDGLKQLESVLVLIERRGGGNPPGGSGDKSGER